MPKERKFVNPLTQKTDTQMSTEPSTQMNTQASSLSQTQMDTQTSTQADTYTSSEYVPRKRGKEAFERTHERYTFWIEKKLRKRLEALAKREDAAKTTLLNEAIAKLLQERE